MCDCEPTRRDVLAMMAMVGAGALSGSGRAAAGGESIRPATRPSVGGPAVPAVEVLPGLSIYPRSAWGADLPPKRPSEREAVQFLLVHHTASSNTYSNARDVIRSTYGWQTSAAKGWRDVCYQFFIGRDGDVWEGRAGALAGPVRADATGGSQGFAQLVCLLGDFTSRQPTAAAQDALVKVLAWLAERYSLDTSPGATTSFISRGSDRWKAGALVTAPTIAGHRDMTFTACPGEAFYPTVSSLHLRVDAQRQAWSTVIKPAVRLGPVPLGG